MSKTPITDLARTVPRECPHGMPFRNMQLPRGGWNGGVSECACCYGTFGYVDSASYSDNGQSESRSWQPKNLCGTCGGSYAEYRSGGSEEIPTSPEPVDHATVERIKKWQRVR